MITIILNNHNKYAEVEMPAMYEELQLALWKLGLDRVPEKYTLLDLGATFRYQTPLEYFVLRLLEGGMSLLDAVSAIYTVIAPPRPIMAQVQILSSGFRSITELRQEVDWMIKSSAQVGSTCFFPVRGWLVGLDGEMEPARDAVLLQHAEVIGEAVQRMQSWIIHDMGKLASWRIRSSEQFGGMWLSDYVDIKLGGYIQDQPVQQKPDCPLIGQDGNIFNLMGIASRTLKENGLSEQAREMRQRITQCHSYDSALCIIADYVNITSAHEMDQGMDEISMT